MGEGGCSINGSDSIKLKSSAGWEQAAGLPCQSQLEELGEALREVKAEIRHSSHQRTGP
jgi:hypothetical protein